MLAFDSLAQLSITETSSEQFLFIPLDLVEVAQPLPSIAAGAASLLPLSTIEISEGLPTFPTGVAIAPDEVIIEIKQFRPIINGLSAGIRAFVLPESRTARVPVESRTASVGSESRTARVPKEDRSV